MTRWFEVKKVHVEVTGNGILEGFGSANPSSEEDYFSNEVTTYEGCAMAAIRKSELEKDEPVYVKFSADGIDSAEIEIK